MKEPTDLSQMHLYQFAGCDNTILFLARQMTLANTEQRLSLLRESEAVFAAMREAAQVAWPDDSSKSGGIELLEQRVRELACTPSHNDFIKTWGGKKCTVCGTKITASGGEYRLAFCSQCISGVEDARIALKVAVGSETAEFMV